MNKKILLSLLIILTGFHQFALKAQTAGDYRTAASGNWSTPSTWEVFTGLSWIPAVSSPTSLNGNINIRNTHTVTVTSNTTVDDVTIDAGGTLMLSANTFTLDILALNNLVCNGALQISGGDLNMNITNAVAVYGTMLWSDGDIIAGTVNINNGATLTLNTPAAKDLQSATISVNSGGTMNWDDGDINLNVLGGINNNGNIFTSCNNSMSGLGTFNNNSGAVFAKTSTGTTTFNVIVNSLLGTFKGVGTYDFNNLFLNGGTIAPGLSPGIVIVTYADLDPVNYPLLGTNSDLDIEIFDGSGPGTGHDQIVKDNGLTLKGTLRVTETGVVPDGSYTIVIVTSGSITGNFDNVILPPGYTITITSSIVIVTKNTVLPVKLGNFIAKKIGNAIELNWQTSAEFNSDRFEIERSNGNGVFVKIGETMAAGNSSQLLSYHFTDNKPGNGMNIYRLKQIDKDNKFEYSTTRWIKFDDAKNELYILPTVTNGVVSVFSRNKTIIELYNLNGVRQFSKEADDYTQVDLSNYPPGVYLLRSSFHSRSFKIIKK